MKIAIPKTRAEIRHHLRDPLLKNSLFIMLTSISGAGFGFIFWMLAAKLYPAEDVGIATALISSMALLVLLSRFGLDFSIIRFFPGADKSRIFSTSAIITTFFAVIFGVIFIAGVDVISPELHLLKSPRNAALFPIFLAASSVTALTAISFIAIRRAGFQFLQSIVVGTRIVFLIPLVALGAIGIFGALGISFLLALAAALVLLVRSGVRPGLVIDRGFLNEAFHFSAGNYLAGLFVVAPNMILPIMVLNVLGAEQAAYYYIAFAIASLLFTIPNAISTSLFVEGSHGEALKRTVMKSLIAILSLLVPAAAVLYLCGGWVLSVVGADYAAGGLEVLRVMVAASLFAGVNYVYFAIKRVQKGVRGLVVGLGYVFMVMYGVVGVGYAWLVGNGVGSVVMART
ncbi:MAG: oligosaccharide flippase family protein [Methanosarcinales archaeon]|nr:oligosaccharide flippase family protein [Methanosarcinales archaeon]